MTFYADLHVHSRFSRATSRNCDLEHLAIWARKKGIGVVGTGDFTHPAWRAELKEQLVPAEPGLFRLRPDLERTVEGSFHRPAPAAASIAVRFMLSVEISTIYKKGDKTRKIHHLVYAPDFDSADRLVASLSKIGNLHSDGRPILGTGLPASAGDDAGVGTRIVPRAGPRVDPVVRRAGLQVRLRRRGRLLRGPGAAHLRRGDGSFVGPADELAGVVPGSFPAGVQLRRPLAGEAGPGGVRLSTPRWTTSSCAGHWKRATVMEGPWSSFRKRASTTWTATATATSAWSRTRPADATAAARPAASP